MLGRSVCYDGCVPEEGTISSYACDSNGRCHGYMPGIRRIHTYLHDSVPWYRYWHHSSVRVPAHLFVTLVAVLIAGIAVFGLQRSDNAQAASGIYATMPFQGRLTNADGTVVANGNYDVVFSLYTASSGCCSVWDEYHDGGDQITTVDGIFNTTLGSLNSLSGFDFNQDGLWLGITVGSDSEMTPRIRLGAAPYAFNSDTLDGLSSENFLIRDGVSGGQTAYGGVDGGDNLVLRSTQDGSKGNVIVSDDGGNVGLGTANAGDFKVETGGSLGPDTDNAYSLGSDSFRWRDLFLGPSSLHLMATAAETGVGDRDYRIWVGNPSDPGDGTDGNLIISNGCCDIAGFTTDGKFGVMTTNPQGRVSTFIDANSSAYQGGDGFDNVMTNPVYAAFVINSDFHDDTIIPGMTWTSDTGRPIGVMYLAQGNSGSQIRMGTTSDAQNGTVENWGFVLGSNGHVSVGNSSTDTTPSLSVFTGGADIADLNDIKSYTGNSAINITSGSGRDTYKSGLTWSLLDAFDSSNYSQTKPVAGIWTYQDNNDAISMMFGTSSDAYNHGIDDIGMMLDSGKNLEVYNNLTVHNDIEVPNGTVYVDNGNVETDTGDLYDHAIQSAGGSDTLCIDVNGMIGTCASDARLKTNVGDIASGLSVIEQLSPKTYDFISGQTGSSGFLAQDVQQILPGLVHKNTGDDYLSLNYNGILAYAVKAIQELNARDGHLPVNDSPHLAALTVAGPVSFAGTLAVGDTASFAKDVAVAGDLAVGGAIEGNPKTRGIDIPLTKNDTSYEVTGLAFPEDATYAVSVTPSWATTTWVDKKTVDGFVIHFGAAAPKDATLDYLIQR